MEKLLSLHELQNAEIIQIQLNQQPFETFSIGEAICGQVELARQTYECKVLVLSAPTVSKANSEDERDAATPNILQICQTFFNTLVPQEAQSEDRIDFATNEVVTGISYKKVQSHEEDTVPCDYDVLTTTKNLPSNADLEHGKIIIGNNIISVRNGLNASSKQDGIKSFNIMYQGTAFNCNYDPQANKITLVTVANSQVNSGSGLNK